MTVTVDRSVEEFTTAPRKLFIGGQWTEAASGKTFETPNPATGETLDEIAAEANTTSYGLGAGIWTKDISKAHALAKKLRAGTVWINCYNVFDRVPHSCIIPVSMARPCPFAQTPCFNCVLHPRPAGPMVGTCQWPKPGGLGESPSPWETHLGVVGACSALDEEQPLCPEQIPPFVSASSASACVICAFGMTLRWRP